MIEPKPGQILHTTWGYSMTLQDFYKVIDTTKSTMRLRKLEKKQWYDEEGSELCEPAKNGDEVIFDRHTPEPFRVKQNKYGDYKIAQEGTLRVWDGKPLSQNTMD